jgi:formylglycine-generating enzyme required for sulfatase activity
MNPELLPELDQRLQAVWERTDRIFQLVRRSFRNWYQARYPYAFAKFRCVRS